METREPARVVRLATDEVGPLYPPARVLGAGAQRSEVLLERARAELASAEQRARELIAEAEEAARRIRGAAEAEVADAAEAARKAVRVAGARRLRSLVASFLDETARARAAFGVDVQRTSLRFARAVLDVEFAVRPERIADLVGRALEAARGRDRLLVHVHPDDLAMVNAAIEGLRREHGVLGSVVVHTDKRLPAHGVRVETEMGQYDASVEAQLRPLAEHLAACARGEERCA
jgi:flagellar assembly protein FliH